MQLKNAAIERAPEAVPFGHFPLSVHNSECDVLIGRTCSEPDHQSVFTFTAGLEEELRRFGLIEQIRVEDIEFVSLNDFGWWVLRIKVHLVILVPLVALLNGVVVTGLAGNVRN